MDRSVKVQTEGQSNLHNEEPHTLYCLSDVITMIRLRGKECGHTIKHERNENCRENITLKSDRKRQIPGYATAYKEHSPVSEVTDYNMDDHHSVTESDCSERLTIYVHLVSWSRMNGVLSPGLL